MKKNAFTLIEVIGVVVLLSLMVLVLVPTIDKAIKKGKLEADKQVDTNIILAAKNWALDNKKSLPDSVGELTKVWMSQLKDGGYLDKNVKKPSTAEDYNQVCVVIKSATKNTMTSKTVLNYDISYECGYQEIQITSSIPDDTWVTSASVPLKVTTNNYTGDIKWYSGSTKNPVPANVIANQKGKDYTFSVGSGTIHNMYYKATLVMHNETKTSNIYGVKVDNWAPTATASIGTLNTSNQRPVSITLGENSGSGLKEYIVSTSATTPGGTWTQISGKPNTFSTSVTLGVGTYYVYARDMVGNVGKSQAISIVGDTIKPTVTATIGTLSGTTRPISFTLTDTGGSALAGYAVTTTTAVPTTWTTISGNTYSSSVTKGAGTYYIHAKDGAGNTGISQALTVIVDSTPPACVWLSGPTGTTVNGYIKNTQTLTYVLQCTDVSGFNDSEVAVADLESSNTGVATISSVSGATAVTNGFKWTVTANAGATSGTAQIRLKAGAVKDKFNNANVVSGYSTALKTDNTPPSITASNNRGSGWVNSGTYVTVSGNYSDSMSGINTGTLQYSYDRANVLTDWTSKTATSYSGDWGYPRENQVWIRIADNLGNYSGWVDGGWIRILSPLKSWVWYGNWAGPGPSYFYSEYQAREVEKNGSQAHLQWRCLIYVPQGDFYGSWGDTNWGMGFTLYGAGRIYADTGWRDYATAWRNYGVNFGDNCSAWYQGGSLYKSSVDASITPCRTCM